MKVIQNMKKIFTILLFTFLANIHAQKDLQFNFDYAQFKYDSLSNYLEVYYSFNQSALKAVQLDNKYSVNAIIHLQIQNKETGELIVNKDWAYKNEIANNKDKRVNTLLGLVGYVLKKGNYTIYISIKDNDDENNIKEYKDEFNVLPYKTSKFSISNIELSNKIVNDNVNTNSIFYKNTLEVYPNPSMIYGETSPVLFYYAELYHLNKVGPKDVLVLSKLIQNSEGKIVEAKSKKIESRKNSIVDIGFINLKKIPTGTYTFILNLKNKTSGKAYAATKKFFLINPKVKKITTVASGKNKFIESEFGILTMEECDKMFDESKLIASQKEIASYTALDSLKQKRKFLFDFWSKRDTEPATKRNEFKDLYFERIKYCNEHFRGFTLPGYKTDRGRIYTLYGKPSEIERHPSSSNLKPYVIWKYNNIEGGAYFIFGDLTGFNNYELIHSTKRGELQDPNWQRRLSM